MVSSQMTSEMRDYTVSSTVKPAALLPSSELPAQAESANRAVANGAS